VSESPSIRFFDAEPAFPTIVHLGVSVIASSDSLEFTCPRAWSVSHQCGFYLLCAMDHAAGFRSEQTIIFLFLLELPLVIPFLGGEDVMIVFVLE